MHEQETVGAEAGGDTSALATASQQNMIKENDTVVFDINHGYKVHFVKVSPKTSFHVGRAEVPSTALVGHPYGTLFEVDAVTDELVPVPYVPGPNEWKQDDHAFERLEGHTTSSGILPSPSNQKLTKDDITRLREEGIDGTKLVDRLETNSSTFDDKNVLAQKKFRKKKERKHVLVGCARRPTAKTLSEAYFTSKHTKKVGNLRPDSLAMALCLANVGAYQKVLVVEQSAGLVAGAVMERLGGYGECCVTHAGKNKPNLSVIESFNFDERIGGVLSHKPLVELLSEVHGLEDRSLFFTHRGKRYAKQEAKIAEGDADAGDGVVVEDGVGDPCGNGKGADVDGDAPNPGKEETMGRESDDPYTTADAGDAGNAGQTKPPIGTFTSCIITATNYSQKSLLLSTLPLLAPSASFVVVSPTLQPLVETMNLLRVRGLAVATTINEPWKRDIQVLPKRTHPDMNMDHVGGYILSGTVSKRGRWINLSHFKQDKAGGWSNHSGT